MANFSHFTRGSVVSMTQHFERKKDENGDYIKFKNEKIDPSRSHLNYNLAEDKNQIEFITKRTKELKCLNRKNVNVLGSWLVTVPKEIPQEYHREFFQKAYDFLEKKYGKENVVSAWVHMDETTPHLHFSFVPVVRDKEKNRDKVCCKECVTQLDLKQFHPQLQKFFNQWINENDYDFDCRVMNGATSNGNKTIEELKAESLQAENEYLEDKFVELTNTVGTLIQHQEIESDNLDTLSKTRKSLKNEIFELKAEIDDLTQKKAKIASENLIEQEKAVDIQKTTDILNRTLEETMEKGVKMVGSIDGLMEQSLLTKKLVALEKRMSLFERFIQLPQIKPLWESFSRPRTINKSRTTTKAERE